MLRKGEPITPLSREETKVARQRLIVRLLVCARARNQSAIRNRWSAIGEIPIQQLAMAKAQQNTCSSYHAM